MSDEQRRMRVRRALDVLERPSDALEEFSAATLDAAADLVAQDEVVDTTWAAVHFAAGARWPTHPWAGARELSDPHVWVPSDLTSIRNWVISTIYYAREELLKACPGCRA